MVRGRGANYLAEQKCMSCHKKITVDFNRRIAYCVNKACDRFEDPAKKAEEVPPMFPDA